MGVNKKRLINGFKELVSIDSLSFRERMMADYLKKIWSELGVSLLEDDTTEKTGGNAGNLYGIVHSGGIDKTSGNPILIAAHMDTVAPGQGKRAVVHKNGRITSDGTTVLGADDAAALAVIFEAVQELREENIIHNDIYLLFTVAEEAYTVGASCFDFSKFSDITPGTYIPEEAYVLDCSDVAGAYSAQEPTLLSFEIRIRGKAAHAGFDPDKGINAIAISAAAISQIRQGRANEHTTFNIGTIQGGRATNIVSDEVILKGEIRSAVHEDALQAYDDAVSIFRQEADKQGASIESEMHIHLTAYHIADDDIALIRYKNVLKKTGIQPYAKASFGGSDNNVFIRKGIHGLCIYNPMHQIHTTQEYTTVDELEIMTEIVKELVK